MINNDFYENLKEDWYTSQTHPVALLRAENRLRAPWILDRLKSKNLLDGDILDVGCGGGFLSNFLSGAKYRVTGIDLSQESLRIAEQFDTTKKTTYVQANAYHLPFSNESFDAVCAMDILEHVENPALLIQEASRVLKPNGLFFFHTFNRNWLSYLFVIKGVDWIFHNAPPNMHVYNLFLKPKELQKMCSLHQLSIQSIQGCSPLFFSKPFFKMLWNRTVSDDLSFYFCKNLLTGYTGFAAKTMLL